MKALTFLLAGLVLGLGPAGCAVARKLQPLPDPMEIPGAIASADELQDRLAAARQIGSDKLRDRTLAHLAREAADATLTAQLTEALDGISTPDRKDAATAHCALRLALRGRSDLGVELAGRIAAPDVRDRTLSRLAMGK